MSNSVQFLWEQATAADVEFSVDAVNCWPPDMLDRLLAEGLVTPGSTAKFVPCDDCDGSHVEPVEWRETVTEPKPFIRCPEYGVIPLRLDRLRQWKVDSAEFAKRTSLLLLPNISRECVDRIKSSRFTDADRLDVLEQLTGLPTEAKMAKRRKPAVDPDAQRLAFVTNGLANQAKLLIEFLWNRRALTDWNDLPKNAFRHGQSVKLDTIFDALKDLRKLCTKNFASWEITISVSESDQTVELVKHFSTNKGK